MQPETTKKTRAPRTPTDKLAAVKRLMGVMNPDEIYKLGHQFAIQSPMSADILRKGVDEGMLDRQAAKQELTRSVEVLSEASSRFKTHPIKPDANGSPAVPQID